MDTDTEAFRETVRATAALAAEVQGRMADKGLRAQPFDVTNFLGKVLVGEDLWNGRPDVRAQWIGLLHFEVERQLSKPGPYPV